MFVFLGFSAARCFFITSNRSAIDYKRRWKNSVKISKHKCATFIDVQMQELLGTLAKKNGIKNVTR